MRVGWSRLRLRRGAAAFIALHGTRTEVGAVALPEVMARAERYQVFPVDRSGKTAVLAIR